MKNCNNCNKEIPKKIRRKYCSDTCKNEYVISGKYKKQVSKILSIKRKEFLKNNPDKHPWKRANKHKSMPCEYLKRRLKERNISFVEEFSPLLHKGRYYSADIAFPNKKIIIEVNGNQHYTSKGVLTKYYQERHDNIVNDGWTVIELHYTSVYNIDIEELLNFDYTTDDYTSFIQKAKEKNKTRTRQEYIIELKKHRLKKNEPIVKNLKIPI